MRIDQLARPTSESNNARIRMRAPTDIPQKGSQFLSAPPADLDCTGANTPAAVAAPRKIQPVTAGTERNGMTVEDPMCYKCATGCATANVMRSINMSTTTIRLEDELKARIAAAAARSGRSSHAFILDALSDMVERSELDEELHRIADKRWAALQRTGESVAWEDAAGYLNARAAGQKPRWPLARRPGL
jgi:predicted transcriptional regulator